jgi:hypothetical protein
MGRKIQGLNHGRKRFFSSPKCPNQFWDPFSLLFLKNQNSFPRVKQQPGVKLTTHLHLVSRLRVHGVHLYSPCPHSIDKDNFTFAFNVKYLSPLKSLLVCVWEAVL